MIAESIDRLIDFYLALVHGATLALVGASFGVILWNLRRRFRQRV